jgi:hypothetical protein
MENPEKIFYNSKLLAIIIYASFDTEGIAFFTTDDFSQQLGYMKRPSGYVIVPHRHNIVKREVQHTQEVLFIKSGTVRVDFYCEQENYLWSKILNKGDVILLASGGHGFEIIESAEIIEVKQGPYVGDKDKIRFEQISKSKLIIK